MFIDAPDEATLDGPAAEWYESQRAAWGYLPNYAPAFALRPDVAEAWSVLSDTVRGHMDRRRYELATIAAARAYRSTYCTAAHSKFLRDNCDDEATMLALAADPVDADLAPVDRAVFDFATQVAEDASSITAGDVQRLRDLGLGDAEVVDVALAAAARAFFTKALDALGVHADAQLGDTFAPDVRRHLTVGRPIADP